MAFLGGALHAPSNYDALAYRLPRILHWLAAGQWQWVHTHFPRLNNRACGIEWVSAPFISLFRTDRWLFLINFISFLFLPGLVFSVLTRLGVRRRVAWHWMWIAPSGYCFLLQAGSISNDAFAAPFSLAAIDFALRAGISKRPVELFWSILAAAMLTSAKTSNLPLLLPWAIAILPSLKLLLQRPIATAIVCLMAIFASFLPTAILNAHFCGDWSGVSLEADKPHGNVIFRTAANIVLLGVINLNPPVFPEADQWNRFVQKELSKNLNLRLHETLTEPAAAEFQTNQMQAEENTGLGFGVTVLLLISAVFAAAHSGKSFLLRFHSADTLWRTGIIIIPWISTLALLSQSEVYPVGRLLASYYILLFPLLLVGPEHEGLVKRTWWRFASFIVFALAALLLVISPARPLFPVKTFLEKIEAHNPGSKLLARAEEVYAVYRDRNNAFAPALNALPPGLKTLGFITYDDPETSLWRPFGSRRIIHVCPDDSAGCLKAEGVEYILAKADLFGTQFPGFDVWLAKVNGRLVKKMQLNLRAATGANDWYLIQLN
ncbi:MAG TPA: hypothetical protein VMO20_04380 [Candidatus Acidoferrum sp.]|nr:hypothetical protein [Candidatus Acidoferrum sp.]